MDKKFLVILTAIILIFIGIIVFGGSGKQNSSNTQPTNHVEGNGKSGVTLIEYGDYECPVCSEYEPAIEQAFSSLSDQIYFQFRNLPLDSIHPNARAAARAAEAAADQNKFWQMHKLLYANQDPNGQSGWVASKDPLNEYFVKYAQQIGLNIDQFKSDYASSQTNDKINADLNAFSKTGQPEATPTFFINGKVVDLSQLVDSTRHPSASKIESVLKDAIQKS